MMIVVNTQCCVCQPAELSLKVSDSFIGAGLSCASYEALHLRWAEVHTV